MTAADFEILAAAGINAVRLPVGYWALAATAEEAAPFVPGAWACIDAALEWGFQSGIGEQDHVSGGMPKAAVRS